VGVAVGVAVISQVSRGCLQYIIEPCWSCSVAVAAFSFFLRIGSLKFSDLFERCRKLLSSVNPTLVHYVSTTMYVTNISP
jgi:hypothetical protein